MNALIARGRAFLHPNIFPDQPERNRLAQLIYVYLVCVEGVIVLLFVLMLIVRGPRDWLIIPLVCLAPAIALLVGLVRLKQLDAAIWLYLGLGMGTMGALSYVSGGVYYSLLPAGLIILVLAAATFKTQRASLGVALTAVGMELILALLPASRPPINATVLNAPPLLLWLAHSILILSAWLVVRMASETMRGALDRAQRELSERRKSESRWRAVFEHSAAGIALGDLDGRILETNPAFQHFLGYTSEDINRHRFSELTHPDDLPLELVEITRLISGELDSFQIEKRYQHQDGSHVWARMTASLVPDDNGKPLFGLSIVDDISDRVKAENALRQLNLGLESRVAQRTAELQAANRELEAFAYSVSHDLRAPLRAIDGYSRYLELDFTDLLDEDGRQLLGNIRHATQKMNTLIDDLLKLSRVNQAEMNLQPVNLSQLSSDILAGLQQQDPQRKVAVYVEPDLHVTADPNLLQVALDNLLRNAWKFSSQKSLARIEVGCMPGTHPTVYFVRDNGAGFSMQYVEKLFVPFQRLHAPDEFEGTGVGLATVQRVIRRHEGQVWAEARLNEGATFYFSIGVSA